MLNDDELGHKSPSGCATMEIMFRMPLALAWLCFIASAQEVHPVTGRQIAPVMGVGGADWLVRSEREAEEAPDVALNAIGIPRGATVAMTTMPQRSRPGGDGQRSLLPDGRRTARDGT